MRPIIGMTGAVKVRRNVMLARAKLRRLRNDRGSSASNSSAAAAVERRRSSVAAMVRHKRPRPVSHPIGFVHCKRFQSLTVENRDLPMRDLDDAFLLQALDGRIDGLPHVPVMSAR